MRNRFDDELDYLNERLIFMAHTVETAIENAIKALVKRDSNLAKQVMNNDEEINKLEKEVESICLRLILKQHPVASDLRLISSALKMITDLERIGDQASDIAEISLSLNGYEFIKPVVKIPEMSKITIEMVNKSIQAYTTGDLDLADRVISMDDIVDNLFDEIKSSLMDLIHKDPSTGEEALDLLMIAKYLERIGDHAENISGWVIFSITGKSPKV